MIFIDTGIFIGLAITNDQHHNASKKIFSELLSQNIILNTTNFIVVETYNSLCKNHQAAQQTLKRIKNNP